jgi:hypothetical protein
MSIARLDGSHGFRWLRPLLWGVAGLLLMLPLWAMTFAPGLGFNWTLSDFLFAALLIGGVGLAFELAVRVSGSLHYRAGAALGLAAGFLLVWANGAVGYIGSEDNPYNLVFYGVIAIAFAGALISVFRARGMAWTMAATAAAHAAAGFGGAAHDPRTIPLTIGFVIMWLGASRLFQMAAKA